MTRRRRNIIAVILIGLLKGVWYATKGIALTLWFVLTSIAAAIAWCLRAMTKRKAPSTTTSATTGATETPSMSGTTRHTATAAPLAAANAITGSFDDFLSRLTSTSTIVLIAGKRGSGKSTLGFRILENIAAGTRRRAYVLGVKAEVLPRWITSISDVDQVDNGGVVLVDEGALTFSSRDSMNKKNKDLGKLLAIARHKDLTLLLITQNTGMIDKNVLNLCDTVMLKEGSLLQQRMERDAMKELYAKADNAMHAIDKKERVSHVYVVDNDFEGLVRYTIPSFWNTSISKNRA